MNASNQDQDRDGLVIRIPIIRIPWDSNTVRGFACAILIICVFVSISPYIKLPQQVLHSDSTSIPIEVLTKLHFGQGDATGKSRGNLQAEGKAAHSQTRLQHFEDASAPKHGAKNATAKPAESKDLSVNVKPVQREKDKNEKSTAGHSDQNSTVKKTDAPDASSSVAKGEKNAKDDGTGRGVVGTGPGSGLGYSIEWGGGGNVAVLNKSIPRPPSGLNNSTIVRLKFVVDRNGDVESVIPLTRGAPQAESAALKAMWLWKFRVKNEQRAEGVIKFTFDVN